MCWGRAARKESSAAYGVVCKVGKFRRQLAAVDDDGALDGVGKSKRIVIDGQTRPIARGQEWRQGLAKGLAGLARQFAGQVVHGHNDGAGAAHAHRGLSGMRIDDVHRVIGLRGLDGGRNRAFDIAADIADDAQTGRRRFCR